MRILRISFLCLAILVCLDTAAYETGRVRIAPFQTQKGPDETGHLMRSGYYPVVAMPSKTAVEFDKRFSAARISLACEPGSRYEGWTLLRIAMTSEGIPVAGDAIFGNDGNRPQLAFTPALADSVVLDVMGNATLDGTPHNYYFNLFPASSKNTGISLEYWLRSPDGSATEIVSHKRTLKGKAFRAGSVTVVKEMISAALTDGWSAREHIFDEKYYRDKVLDLIKRCNIASCQVTFQDHIDSIGFVVVNEDYYDEKPLRRGYVTRPFDMHSIYQAASMSKVPCGYIFAKMADDGEVDLDTPLYEYYPGLLNRIDPRYREQAKLITGRMALTHTSGCGAGYGNIPLDYYPGYHHNYRNSNITILQYVIEYLKGKRIDEVAQDYIYSKRDMPLSSYSWRPEFDSLAVTAFTDTVPYNKQKDWLVNDFIKYSDFPWDKDRTGIDNNTSYHWRTNSTECNRFWSWFLEGADLSEEMFNQFIDQGIHMAAADQSLERGTLFQGLATRTELHDELGPVTYHTGRNGPFRSLGIAFLERNAALSFFTNSRHYYAMYYPLLDLFIPHCEPMSWTLWVADAGTPVPGWETTADSMREARTAISAVPFHPNPIKERVQDSDAARVAPSLPDTASLRAAVRSILERSGIPAMEFAYSDGNGVTAMTVTDGKSSGSYNDSTLCLAGELGALPLVYEAMRLVEQGRLYLDAPMVNYSQALLQRFNASSLEAASRITSRQCLGHLTGVSMSNSLFKTGRTPGATYSESRVNYLLLQALVEGIEGKPFSEICGKNFFGPLGMKRTRYTGSDITRTMRTDAAEFTAFLRFAMAENERNQYAKDALGVRRVHVAAPEYSRERFSLWRTMGWIVEENPELGTVLLHNGSAGKWRSLAMILPDHGVTLCAFVPDAGRIDWQDAFTEIFFRTAEPLSCFGCGSLYPLDNRRDLSQQ